MNTEKLFNILISEYNLSIVKLEYDLERAVNSEDTEIEKKTKKIENILSKIVNKESCLAKLISMLPTNNKKQIKTKTND